MFSRTAARVTLFLLKAVGFALLLESSYSSANIVLKTIKVLFFQKFKVFLGFVYLFVVYEHQSARLICLNA